VASSACGGRERRSVKDDSWVAALIVGTACWARLEHVGSMNMADVCSITPGRRALHRCLGLCTSAGPCSLYNSATYVTYWFFWQIGTFYVHITYTPERPIVQKIQYLTYTRRYAALIPVCAKEVTKHAFIMFGWSRSFGRTSTEVRPNFHRIFLCYCYDKFLTTHWIHSNFSKIQCCNCIIYIKSCGALVSQRCSDSCFIAALSNLKVTRARVWFVIKTEWHLI